ncbi:MAG: type II secretion system protein [Deltaproteobacteria bacterium]|nr:type II secretion system protein [Deltaproteobacteria bacterium]
MWNWKKIRRSKRGFTLLEIIIAVAILSGALLALLSGQGSSFLASERAERLSLATNLARQKISEAELKVEAELAKNKFPDDQEEIGTFDAPFESFRWKTTLSEVEIPVITPPEAEGGEDSAAASVGVEGYLQTVTKQISEAVRELQVTIYWGDPDLKEEDQPHLTVTTHVVKMK